MSFRRFNPFGVGVFLSYLWAQFAEMTNLRSIINGISFGLGSGQIRKVLIYV
jgi:vacuolar-type H+-ATPase subunit C/Vma6